MRLEALEHLADSPDTLLEARIRPPGHDRVLALPGTEREEEGRVLRVTEKAPPARPADVGGRPIRELLPGRPEGILLPGLHDPSAVRVQLVHEPSLLAMLISVRRIVDRRRARRILAQQPDQHRFVELLSPRPRFVSGSGTVLGLDRSACVFHDLRELADRK